jgi:hypothetical protein
MNEEYTVIPKDEVKYVTFPFIKDEGQDFLTDETIHSVYKNIYLVFAYKYIIREDMFVDDVVTLDFYFYLGTRFSPRKTIGNKYSSNTLSIQFTTKVKNKDELEDRMWEYIYSIERMNADQLLNLSYKTYYNDDLQSENEEDVIKIFKTIGYLV